MKRKDMRGEIAGFLYSFRHRIIKMTPQDRENTDFLTDNLLLRIEAAGMLPPERFFSAEGGFVHEWEGSDD